MAAELTPMEIVDKQIRAATQHAGDFKKGVQNTKKNPMQLAKAKKEKMRNNLLAALDDGKWEDGLDSVSVEEWKELTAGKGGDNYAKGVAASRNKMIQFQEQFTPFRRQVRDQVQSMPDETFEDRIKRMEANAVGLHSFRFRKRGARRV